MMQTALDIAGKLGIRAANGTAMDMVGQVRRGLPVAAIDQVARAVAPQDAGFRYRIVPKATLARRKDTLSAEEGERLMRVAGAWQRGLDVWGGADAARRFLFAPHALLDGAVPIDVILESELGARVVDEILGRLAYGSAV